MVRVGIWFLDVTADADDESIDIQLDKHGSHN